MSRECSDPTCRSPRIVPVLDRRQQRSPIGGNPYRSICDQCGSWQQLVSKEEFKQFADPYVLPADADPGDRLDAVVRLSDYKYKDELRRLAEMAHKFTCPNPECEAPNRGFPNYCYNCSAEFEWEGLEKAYATTS